MFTGIDPLKYDIEIRTAIRGIKKPFHGLVVDVVMHDTWVELRVYEDQIMELSDLQQQEIMAYLLACKTKIKSFGIRCEPLGAAGKPPRINA